MWRHRLIIQNATQESIRITCAILYPRVSILAMKRDLKRWLTIHSISAIAAVEQPGAVTISACRLPFKGLRLPVENAFGAPILIGIMTVFGHTRPSLSQTDGFDTKIVSGGPGIFADTFETQSIAAGIGPEIE